MIQLDYDSGKEFSGCWFCWPREQGKHGKIVRVPSRDWGMLQVCQKHAKQVEAGDSDAKGMDAEGK